MAVVDPDDLDWQPPCPYRHELAVEAALLCERVTDLVRLCHGEEASARDVALALALVCEMHERVDALAERLEDGLADEAGGF